MVNVAIDGPSGAGKSTIAKIVAKRLGYIYLDTGAMYRAAAYYALKKGVDPADEAAASKLVENIEMDIRYNKAGEQEIYVFGKNVTPHLREHHMSKAASDISAHPAVRYKLVELQREFAKTRDVVLDGRDIGTFVLPDAKFKFFMTATADERARRRHKELLEKGGEVPDLEKLKADIEARDHNDSTRAVAPLRRADDAELIDTTSMTIDEVSDFIYKRVKETVIKENKIKMKELTLDEVGNEKKKKKNRFIIYRIARFFVKPVLLTMFPTTVINPENYYKVKGGAVCICNHYSIPDTLVPAAKFFKKELHVLAKAEAFHSKIGGPFLRSFGAIPVHRGEADLAAIKAVLTVLKEDKQFLIFPEGTRNREGTQVMGEFKQGAARFAIKAKKPIIPMMYYRKHKLFRRNFLYVGEPIYLDEFYGAKTSDDYKRATELLENRMKEIRVKLNEAAEKKLKIKR
jgi:cytidylate kinase